MLAVSMQHNTCPPRDHRTAAVCLMPAQAEDMHQHGNRLLKGGAGSQAQVGPGSRQAWGQLVHREGETHTPSNMDAGSSRAGPPPRGMPPASYLAAALCCGHGCDAPPWRFAGFALDRVAENAGWQQTCVPWALAGASYPIPKC